MIHERNPKFEFFAWFFLKNLNQSANAVDIKTSFDMWLLFTLCQIWGHLNNARWINGPQVANWGWGRHMIDSTSYLNYIW